MDSSPSVIAHNYITIFQKGVEQILEEHSHMYTNDMGFKDFQIKKAKDVFRYTFLRMDADVQREVIKLKTKSDKKDHVKKEVWIAENITDDDIPESVKLMLL